MLGVVVLTKGGTSPQAMSHYGRLERQTGDVNQSGNTKMSTFGTLKILTIATTMLFATTVSVFAESSFGLLRSYYSLDAQLPLSLEIIIFS